MTTSYIVSMLCIVFIFCTVSVFYIISVFYIFSVSSLHFIYCWGSRKFAWWAALLKAVRDGRIVLYAYRIMFKSCRKRLQRQRKQWERRASNSYIVIMCLFVVIVKSCVVVKGSVASHTEETSSYEKSA